MGCKCIKEDFSQVTPMQTPSQRRTHKKKKKELRNKLDSMILTENTFLTKKLSIDCKISIKISW